MSLVISKFVTTESMWALCILVVTVGVGETFPIEESNNQF